MVIISWLKNMFSKRNKNTFYELDKNRESLNRLIDLTTRLDEMETDIRRHEEFLNTVVNSWDSPMWVKGVDGHFLFVNTACAEIILRSTVDEALHLTDLDFKKDALAPVCIESDKKVMATLKPMRFIEHARYNGSRDLWLDVVKTPLIINGELVGTIGMADNITNIVSKEIKEIFKKPASVQIDFNLKYYTGAGNGKRKNDLREILESCKEGC